MQPLKNMGVVVLRNLPSKQTVMVCDKTYGLITLGFVHFAECQRIWPGMLLAYAFEGTDLGDFYRALRVDIISPALCNNYESLKAWQRILTLSWLFNERGIPNESLYNILHMGHQIVSSLHAYLLPVIEPWMSMQILYNAGYWHPTYIPLLDNFFLNLSVLIDSLAQPEVELFRAWLYSVHAHVGDELQEWLIECAQQHPRYASFAHTITFKTPLPTL